MIGNLYYCRELKTMSKWNPKLENSLLLEAAELKSQISRSENEIRSVKCHYSPDMLCQVQNVKKRFENA